MLGRRRPLARAAVIGGGAYALGKHRANKQAEATDEPVDDQPAQVEEPEQAAQAPSGLTDQALDELGKLGTLKDQGVLTQEEFDAEKAKILASA
jgi:hypothetical protein